MSDYDNFNDLISAIESKIPQVLEDYAVPVMKDILCQHIYTDIYQSYVPTPNGWIGGSTYQRRRNLPNSLYDIIEREDDGYVAMVTSNETFSPIISGYSFNNNYNPGAFLEMIETGNMGIWKSGFPRPAVSNAQKEINTSSQLKEAIQKGLEAVFA